MSVSWMAVLVTEGEFDSTSEFGQSAGFDSSNSEPEFEPEPEFEFVRSADFWSLEPAGSGLVDTDIG